MDEQRRPQLAEIPPEYMPAIQDLPGDLSRIAARLEDYLPGQGVWITMALAQVFRGQTIYFRSIDYILREIRDNRIRAAYDGGERLRDIALRNNLSARTVEQILSRPPATREELRCQQLGLF